MSARKSIQPIDPVDIGGISPRADELVTTETIGYLNTININSRLLEDDDPLKEEYTKFLSNLGNSPIVISNADIDIGDGGSYFDDVDLSGSLSEEETIVVDNNMFVANRLWANGEFGSVIFPPMFITPPSITGMRCDKFKAGTMTIETIPMGFQYLPTQLSGLADLTLKK